MENDVFDVFVSYARSDWRHAADSGMQRCKEIVDDELNTMWSQARPQRSFISFTSHLGRTRWSCL